MTLEEYIRKSAEQGCYSHVLESVENDDGHIEIDLWGATGGDPETFVVLGSIVIQKVEPNDGS